MFKLIMLLRFNCAY